MHSKITNPLLDRDQAVLLIIDMQERLIPALADSSVLLQRQQALIHAAGIFSIPIVVTEQAPQSLGRTITPLAEALGQQTTTVVRVEKSYFSAFSEPMLKKQLTEFNRSQIIVAGAESHVCVLQTSLELAAYGYRPLVVRDAVASRKPEDKEAAFARLTHHEVEQGSTEMVITEWLRHSGGDAFKALLPIFRAFG